MTIIFRCGHRRELADTFMDAPRCRECGETLVSRALVRPPRFVGTVRGPCAEYQDLAAMPVDLRSKELAYGRK